MLHKVSCETLEQYQVLLHKWQKTINLVSPASLQDSWTRHFEDSLQLSKYIPQNISCFDLGSGAGFPGLVIAITRPDLKISLVESDERKCAFLRQVSRETGVENVTIINKRIEDVQCDTPPQIITARALAALNKLFGYVEHWSAPCLFQKGARYQQEIDEARKLYDFDVEVIKSTVHEDSVLLKIDNIDSKRS